MFVQMRKMTVKEGYAEQVASEFNPPKVLLEQEGLVDLKVLVKKVRRGEEVVVVLITWESEQAWKNWEKSDEHIAQHRAKRNQPKPEYILNIEVARYEVKHVITP
ncbi:antibiotic biosynthesis monooxygenase [Fervidibacillus halotolerans]|uniref:Antibiotic biosynthesis monooxygenase n=1 Tax=Fervidibacillus halotolerans TaxID=2980027 RepID=A0A9E8M0G6_9BACI|nr:antibiotic biosynthesis monooxygenase [Fervidibacillus halotolerans]WAA12949.1 antibiotic biosynthesis monooxygenase [Fervidibacillus halotolerans]